ncbi:MAG TPA: hypothetical protein VNJ70_17875 [Thermoanaerobaculia bacterium]|nr:hypothetical protein [Thermoanaerobaculia bacterium]
MRATATACLLLVLLAAPAAAQVCPVTFTTAQYPSVVGPWSVPVSEDRLLDNILGLCGARAEDFGTDLALDCYLKSGAGGTIVCGAAGGGGGAPDPHAASHQNGGSDEPNLAGLSGLLADPQTPLPHTHVAADTNSGVFAAARLPAATTTGTGIVELATDGEVAANLVPQANDTRLSNARTPTAHAASHAEDAADQLLVENLGTACSSGEIPKANAGGGWDCADDETTAGGGGGGPEGDQYHPDREPASCAVCEAWEGNTAALTWEWFNQDTATETVEMDGATIVGEATGDEARGRAVDPPSSGNVDLTVTAKVHFYAGTGSACGIGILDGGTLASPTNVVYTYASQGSLSFNDATSFDFSTASGLWGGVFPATTATWTGGSYCIQLRYTDSTRVVRAYWSRDCYLFREPASGSTTLSNDPIKVFYFTRDTAVCHVQWFRVRTGANRDLAGE